jgi:hypothetical protein
MPDYAWFPFLIYFLLIVCPLSIFCFFAVPKLRSNDSSLGQAVVTAVASYMTNFPVTLFLYHLVITSVLALFYVGIVIRHLDIAVDLTYYTKASIQTYEVTI